MKLRGKSGEGNKRDERGKNGGGVDLIQEYYLHVWILDKILKKEHSSD